MRKSRQINLPCGDRLHKTLLDYARKNEVYLTTLIWTSLVAQHPELAEAIQDDRL